MKLTPVIRIAVDVILIIVMISVVIMLVRYVKDDGVKCLEQPFLYGARWFEDKKDIHINCICYDEDPGEIRFNSTFYGRKLPNRIPGTGNIEVNWTKAMGE